jgi:hypothetical protein
MSRPGRAVAVAGLLFALLLSGCASQGPGSGTASTSHAGTSRATSAPPVTVTQTQTFVETQTLTQTVTSTVAPTTSSTGTGGSGTDGLQDHAPVVNETRLAFVDASSARIEWNVSDDSPSVQSRVEYGMGEGNFTSHGTERIGKGPQSDTLYGLRSCTTYAYRVTATDSADHTGVGLAAAPRFRTTGATPTVANLTFPKVMHNSMTVSWVVTGPVDTLTQLEYGPTTAYGSLSEARVGAGLRSVTITGLVQNTDYTFRVRITSPCGDSVTAGTVQRTATLVHVDIKGNLGATGSFDKGSTVYGALAVTAGQWYVFEVKNADSALHTFSISGAAPYSSGDIPAGATYTFQTSIKFAAGTYHMGCAYHSGMDGTIQA